MIKPSWCDVLTGELVNGVMCDVGDGQTDLIYSWIWVTDSELFLVGEKNKRYDPTTVTPIAN